MVKEGITLIICKQIPAAQLDMFVSGHPYGHYMKTSMWAALQKHDQPHFIGFYDHDELKGTAMILERKSLGIHYFYVPWGPCLDYDDPELCEQGLRGLIQLAENAGVDFLRIDPNVLRMERDIKGNPIEGGENHEDMTALLTSLGFVHKGYGYAYNGSWVNRYTLIIDLSPSIEEIVRHFSKPRQNSLRRHAVIGVTTRLGTKADLPQLCEFERQLSQIQGFQPHPQSFFEALLDAFGDHAALYVTEIDLDQMISGIQHEIDSGKYNKDPEALQSKLKEKEKAAALKARYGAKPAIAAGLFLRLGTQSWDLYTYNHKDFNFIKAVDNLHRFAIEDMKNHGVLRYDMCGFSGVTEKSDPHYGLYDYKRSFGSVYTERIGEFDYIRKPARTARWKKADRFRRRVKRKLISLRYGKQENHA